MALKKEEEVKEETVINEEIVVDETVVVNEKFSFRAANAAVKEECRKACEEQGCTIDAMGEFIEVNDEIKKYKNKCVVEADFIKVIEDEDEELRLIVNVDESKCKFISSQYGKMATKHNFRVADIESFGIRLGIVDLTKKLRKLDENQRKGILTIFEDMNISIKQTVACTPNRRREMRWNVIDKVRPVFNQELADRFDSIYLKYVPVAGTTI
jgi:hypothetical protein